MLRQDSARHSHFERQPISTEDPSLDNDLADDEIMADGEETPKVLNPGPFDTAHIVQTTYPGPELSVKKPPPFSKAGAIPARELSSRPPLVPTSARSPSPSEMIQNLRGEFSNSFHQKKTCRRRLHREFAESHNSGLPLEVHALLQSLAYTHYRKRGSASYIVREVLLVREREIQRKRER